MLALGDALAVVLLQAHEFTLADFALSHPAGSLGKRLLIQVKDLMHTGDELPAVGEGTLLKDGIVRMSETGLGMLAIVNKHGCIKGIFTDGDLRRLFQGRDDFTGLLVEEVMHPGPQTISPDKLANEALKRGDTVLDLFGGSGSTLIACEKTARSARLMEIDPRYVDVIVRRWQDFTGQRATHAETGAEFPG